jgi:hypothetical protein
MAQSPSDTVPSWRDLPAAQRRRLTVLIGRLALRRLPLVTATEMREGGAADEADAEFSSERSASWQDPHPPP